jgi:hypothetical protein
MEVTVHTESTQATQYPGSQMSRYKLHEVTLNAGVEGGLESGLEK